MSHISDMADTYIFGFLSVYELEEDLSEEQHDKLVDICEDLFDGIRDWTINIPYDCTKMETDFVKYVLETYSNFIRNENRFLHLITDAMGKELTADLYNLNLDHYDESREKLITILYRTVAKMQAEDSIPHC